MTAGQAACTLDITLDDSADAKPRFTDCEAAEIVFTRASDTQLYNESTKEGFYQVTINGLKIGDGTAASIKAEYSGDHVYQTSASDEKFFEKIDTTIDVKNAFKPETVRATFDAILTWDKAKANGRTPSGSVTFTIGADACKLEIDPSDPTKYTSFSCTTDGTSITGTLTEEDPNQKLTWKLVRTTHPTASRRNTAGTRSSTPPPATSFSSIPSLQPPISRIR